MVEAWTRSISPHLYALRDDNGKVWHRVKMYPTKSYTNFDFRFQDSQKISIQSEILFYPLQWTRVCLSKDSNSSLTRLVVDGQLLIEQEVKVKNQPDNLDLALGALDMYEFPG